MPSWFDVDRAGLRKLLEAKGRGFAVLELVQNAWDADDVTHVFVTLEPLPGVPKARLTVLDDSPVGFQNLAHAWTLFAESNRKGDPTRRGRFNLGEKLVLALCETARITTTTGCVSFDAEGRHTHRERREAGSVFEAVLPLTREELAGVAETMQTLIPPVSTHFNGEPIWPRRLIVAFETPLQTEYADAEGVLRRSVRTATVEVREPLPGKAAQLYELGIPVVETGDRWDVNVLQKVPLNINRDNVPPAYLRDVRTAVLNVTYPMLQAADTTAPWVRSALEDPDVEPAAVTAVVAGQFGPRRVIYDPSDPEGTKLAVARGYTVIPANTFSAEAWANIRTAGAALPAGRVTPSPKPFSEDGRPLEKIPEERWTVLQRRFVAHARWLHAQVFPDVPELRVELTADRQWAFGGCYGSGVLTVNVSRVDLGDNERVHAFLIHEFAHRTASDHLSEEYHRATCRVGARVAGALSRHPQRYGWARPSGAADAPAVTAGRDYQA